MSDRRKIEDRIKRKEQEIQSLEAHIKEARIYIQALQDVLKMLPRDAAASVSSASSSSPSVGLRAGSLPAQAREVILKEGKPMHVTLILQRLGKEGGRGDRITLSGSLAAYVRKGEVFTRPSPNTFGLIELGHEEAVREPPMDFGTEDAA